MPFIKLKPAESALFTTLGNFACRQGTCFAIFSFLKHVARIVAWGTFPEVNCMSRNFQFAAKTVAKSRIRHRFYFTQWWQQQKRCEIRSSLGPCYTRQRFVQLVSQRRNEITRQVKGKIAQCKGPFARQWFFFFACGLR